MMSWWAQVALAIIATVNVLALIALVILAYLIYAQMRGLSEKSRVLMVQAEKVLGTVQETATVVGERAERVSGEVTRKAERIADLSEQVAERVAQRVDTTTAIVQEAIANPVVNLASVRTGIGKGLEVWQELSKARGGKAK